MVPNGAEGRRRFDDMAARTFGVVAADNEAKPLIHRQTNTFIFYNHLIEEILDLDAESRPQPAASKKKATKETANAMANLTIEPKPLKVSIAEVVAQAVE